MKYDLNVFNFKDNKTTVFIEYEDDTLHIVHYLNGDFQSIDATSHKFKSHKSLTSFNNVHDTNCLGRRIKKTTLSNGEKGLITRSKNLADSAIEAGIERVKGLD